MPVDYHVLTRLRPREGQPELRTQRSLGGGGEGTASWESGRWVLRSQTLAVPSRAPAGDYELYLALYDSKLQTSPAVTRGGAVGSTEVLLGRLHVR
jgi:hypothetical protein